MLFRSRRARRGQLRPPGSDAADGLSRHRRSPRPSGLLFLHPLINYEGSMLYLEVFFVLLLTVLNGVLAMSELALVSSRRSRLGQLAAQGSGGARTALRLMDDPGGFLSTVQIGITLENGRAHV